MLNFLDGLFTLLHILIILINMLGWIWRKTRSLHRYVLVATWISWMGLGIKYGWGYCFLTDWHWDIKRKLGTRDLPNSFIHYLFDQCGINLGSEVVDWITALSFIAVTIITVTMWVIKFRSQ